MELIQDVMTELSEYASLCTEYNWHYDEVTEELQERAWYHLNLIHTFEEFSKCMPLELAGLIESELRSELQLYKEQFELTEIIQIVSTPVKKLVPKDK